MKPGLPILWTDQQRLRGPGGPVSIGILERLPGLGVRRLRERTPRTAVPQRARASRDAGRARSARLVPARAPRAGNLAAAHDAAAVGDLRDAGNERTPAGVPAGPARSRVAGSVFVPRALTPLRARPSPPAPRNRAART